MKIASIADVKSQFSAYVKSSAEGPVVVTRNGKAVAVLIGLEDEDEIERLLMAYSPQLRTILDKSRRQIAEGKGQPHDQFWAEVESQTVWKRAARRSSKKEESSRVRG